MKKTKNNKAEDNKPSKDAGFTAEEVRALVAALRKAGVDAYTGDQMDEARRIRKARLG
jgi:cell division septation protein DedD